MRLPVRIGYIEDRDFLFKICAVSVNPRVRGKIRGRVSKMASVNPALRRWRLAWSPHCASLSVQEPSIDPSDGRGTVDEPCDHQHDLIPNRCRERFLAASRCGHLNACGIRRGHQQPGASHHRTHRPDFTPSCEAGRSFSRRRLSRPEAKRSSCNPHLYRCRATEHRLVPPCLPAPRLERLPIGPRAVRCMTRRVACDGAMDR